MSVLPAASPSLAVSATVAQPALLKTETEAQRVFRGSADTVAIYATVQDREGRLVPDLRQSDFEVRVDGAAVPVVVFSTGIVPITAVLLLDMSHSMVEHYRRIRDAGRHVIRGLLPGDRMRIGTFGREVALSPWLTNDPRVLERILDEELWPGGATPIWRASSEAMQSLRSEPGRRVVVVVTDGAHAVGDHNCAPIVRDPRGRIGPCPTQSDVLDGAVAGEFMFYAIGLGAHNLGSGLAHLAEQTGGGHADLRRDDDLGTALARIVTELRHQYTLGIPAAFDGKAHTIQVRAGSGRTARARRSYLARQPR
jgi:VWFA-related protein